MSNLTPAQSTWAVVLPWLNCLESNEQTALRGLGGLGCWRLSGSLQQTTDSRLAVDDDLYHCPGVSWQ